MEKDYDVMTVAAVASATPPVPHSEDEWLRLPKPGGRLNGLSRTSLTELTAPCAANSFKPPVRSVLIKKRGAVRGIRLIDKRSLAAYLNRLADDQRQERTDTGTE